MPVFVRTEEGQEAAYSPQSALPRKLKSILKVIDGRTTVNTFEKNLSSFGDVRAILQSLDMAGLIKQIENTVISAPANPTLANDATDRQARPVGGISMPEWVPTRAPYSEQPSISAPAYTQAAAWQASELATQNMSTAHQLSSPVLQEVLDSMANFVLTHLPEQSFQILKEIEEITSLELLAVTLGGYEQMVAIVGEPSVAHLSAIKQTIRKNL